MPDIRLRNQCFDLVFGNSNQIYAGLLTGQVKGFSYDADGAAVETFSLRPTKRSCRGLAINDEGDRLYSVSKDKALHIIDPMQGKVLDERLAAHESAINRVAVCTANLIATGDDEGAVKLWDPRKRTAIRAYTRHFDFISDILFFEDKNHLVTTSGDGTLAVIDVRSPKAEPIAQSDDQDDEFLSICPIKSSSKLVVGTQMGMLSIFNRSSASSYTNPVDRIPGHPSSIDALINLTDDVVATGSSDGMIRLVQILPSKLLGVVADHGEYPVERLALSRDGKWLASASHDEVLKMTDVGNALVDSDEEMDSDVVSDSLGQEGSSAGEKAALEDVGEMDEASHPFDLGGSTTSRSLKRVASPSSLADRADGDQPLARGIIPKSKGAPSALTARTEGGSLQWRSTTGKVPKGKDKKRMKQDITDSTTAAATTFFADL